MTGDRETGRLPCRRTPLAPVGVGSDGALATAEQVPTVGKPDPTERVPSRRRRRLGAASADLLRPIVIVVVARALLSLVIATSRGLTHTPGLFSTDWDSSWYLTAAQHGWPHYVPIIGPHAGRSTLAFFPAFPVLIRGVHTVFGGTWVNAGGLAMFISELAMAVAVWVLTRDIWDRRTADRATVLLCFFPGAFIFALLYSEPLLLAFAAVCLLALRRQHWVLAGLLATLATVTRPNGVALIACCTWAAYQAVRARRRGPAGGGHRRRRLWAWRPLSAPILAPIGIVGWFALLWATTGDRLAWFHTEQGGWGEQIEPQAIVNLIVHSINNGFAHPNQWVPLVGTVAAVAALVVLVMAVRQGQAPSALLVYTAVILGMSIMSKTLGLRPRFVLTAFPLIMIMGYRLRGAAQSFVAAAMAVLMPVLLVVTLSGSTLIP